MRQSKVRFKDQFNYIFCKLFFITAYLSIGDFNIIGVDWGALCPSPLYFAAVENVRPVGEFLGQFIEFLVQEAQANLNSFHVIGHSLGAQVAGLTGQSITSGQVQRITG